jgi:23S rRNA (guanosine2251-2'-O)-methyltransferase
MSETLRVFGFHPVHEVLRHRPGDVRRVWVAERRSGRRLGAVEELCRQAGVELLRLPTADLDRLAPGVHNGFVAELRREPPAAADHGDRELVVIVEDVQDPRNLGAVLRVCEGAGVGRVIVRERGSAPLSAVAVKASAGAAEVIPVERVSNTAQAIEALRREGFWIYGAAAGGREPWSVDLRGKVALCLGGEEKGLRARTRALCDELVGLPMRGRVESLNVATAASALLYEAVRQRSVGSEPAE